MERSVPAEWKLVKRPIVWNDGAHILNRYYTLTAPSFFCHGCGSAFYDNDQAYLFDTTGKLSQIKKHFKGRGLTRTQHLVLYNYHVCCFGCSLADSKNTNVYHKVVLKELNMENLGGKEGI